MELSRQDEWQGHELGATAAILGKNDGCLKQVASMEIVGFQRERGRGQGICQSQSCSPSI